MKYFNCDKKMKYFNCDKCGYEARTTFNGEETRMMGTTKTLLCEHCKELVNTIFFGFIIDVFSDNKPISYPCPKCNSVLSEWDADKMPCPKCRGHLVYNQKKIF
jgi:Zn finger protein HypA/HybF involved in hydrogenase expression